MARVKRSGTAPETALRTAIRSAGLRYRVADGAGLPGTPDLVFRRRKLAVFVDGCFWHGCPRHGTVPKTNTAFWEDKILRNGRRDRRVNRELRALGWNVLRIWEHDIKSESVRTVRRIARLLDSQRADTAST